MLAGTALMVGLPMLLFGMGIVVNPQTPPGDRDKAIAILTT